MRWLFLFLLVCYATADARIVHESEPNDHFTTADQIACDDTVECAHLDISEGDFYRLTVPGGDSVYFRTLPCEGSNEDTYILLYDSTYSLIAYNDDSGPQEFSTLGVFLPFNQLCYVQVVDPAGNSTGGYNLVVQCQFVPSGPNDYCSNARQVTFWPYYDEGSTFGAGHEIGTPAPDVFYQFTLATPGDIFVQVCSEAFNARVQVLLACGSGLMDDADTGECGLGADLYSYQLQAQTYYLLVEGTTANQFGEFSISIEPLLQPCPEPTELKIFDVGGFPFLDWIDVAEADFYLIEQAPNGQGPFESLDLTTESFWQDPLGFSLTRRFYRVRAICE